MNRARAHDQRAKRLVYNAERVEGGAAKSATSTAHCGNFCGATVVHPAPDCAPRSCASFETTGAPIGPVLRPIEGGKAAGGLQRWFALSEPMLDRRMEVWWAEVVSRRRLGGIDEL